MRDGAFSSASSIKKVPAALSGSKHSTSKTENTMSEESTATLERKAPEPRNGVDTPMLFATINAVGEQPELAKFVFRATNRWQTGTHSRTTFTTFSGAGADMSHETEFSYDADHPAPLVGKDKGPTPIEFLLHGLVSCLTAGIGNIAAARGVTLNQVESTIEGDINLLGLLGLDKSIRNGYEGVSVRFKISGDAPAEKLREIVEQSRNRSAVYDVMTNGTAIQIDVDVV